MHQASAAFKSGDGSGEYTFSHVWDQATDQEQVRTQTHSPCALCLGLPAAMLTCCVVATAV